MLKNFMPLSREDVRRVAALARLSLSAEEEERLVTQLGQILQYVEKLNQLDTSSVEPLSHAVDIVNAFRDDTVTCRPNPDGLLANAPAREKNFFKVPKIIE